MKTKRRQFAYLDTSVIVKRYIREAGSQKVRQLGRKFVAVTSEIAMLEMISAMRRSFASGAIDEPAHKAIRDRLQRDRAKLQMVEVRSGILADAEKYVSDFNVRALDAIHLASATTVDERFSGRLAFITADRNQRDAALKLGLEVIWVD